MNRCIKKVVFFVTLIASENAALGYAQPPGRPILSLELSSCDSVTEKRGCWPGTNTNLAFLSNDLLLAAINRRECPESANTAISFIGQDVQRTTTLLLISVTEQKLVGNVRLAAAKQPESVRALQEQRWIVSDDSGVKLCAMDGQCGPPSPWQAGALVSYKLQGETIGRWSPLVQFLFLNDEKVVDLREGAAVVMTLDGVVLYKIPVREAYRNASLVSSTSGARFLLNEFAFTHLNSFISFMDDKASRPRNLKRIRVFDVASRKTLFENHWNPNRYEDSDDLPSLSPDGHRVALVRDGVLEVYEIP